MNDYKAMEASARPSYARRVCGMAPDATQQKYTGDFDFEYIVHGAPLPTGPTFREHQVAWDKFMELLDAEWRAN
ncbi:MAG: hypothetical protein ACR2PF_00325 [Rhizobiaceae bacterium]